MHASVGSAQTLASMGSAAYSYYRLPTSMSQTVKYKKVSTRIQRKPLTHADMARAFHEPMPPVACSLGYRLSLICVACVMLLIPLSYAALVLAVGYYSYQQALLLPIVHPQVLLPALALLFLIKPIFFRDHMAYKAIALKRSAEPLFFDYVDQLCQRIGSAKPHNILLNCELNAGASFHRGFWGLSSNKLDLHLGLPLIVGLDTRQLTGVLAHEFGHFSQGFGMRAGYIIQRVNYSLAKVVYQRDICDVLLERTAQAISKLGRIAHICTVLVHAFIWLNRFVLWLLMHLAQLCSSLLSRQLEFNADRHAIHVVGKNDFVNTLKQLPLIEAAQQGAMSDLYEAWRERRLGDNIPALIYSNMKRIPIDAKEQIIEQGLTQNSNLYDSHPCTHDRIQRSMQLHSTGITSLERRPASDLFLDFEELCLSATRALYQDAYAIDIEAHTLMNTSQLIVHVEQEEAAHNAYLRYFQNQWGYHPLFPMQQHTIDGSVSMEQLERGLRRCHQDYEKEVSILRDIGTELDSVDERIKNLHQALLLKTAGFGFDPHKLSIAADSTEAIQEALDAATREHAHKCTALKPFQDLLIKRMAITYKMLQDPSSDELLEDRDETVHAYKVAREQLMTLSAGIDVLTQLRFQWWSLHGLLTLYENYANDLQFTEALNEQAHSVAKLLKHIKTIFKDDDYPYDHAHGSISIADYLIETLPEQTDIHALYNCSEQCIGHYMVLYHRLLGCIAITGEAVEEACHLPHIIYPSDDCLFPE